MSGSRGGISAVPSLLPTCTPKSPPVWWACRSLAYLCDLFSVSLLKGSYFVATATSCGKGSKCVD